MDLILNLIAGILTGFIVSIPPVGPIAFAIISKGFKNEIKESKAIAMGAAFMDFFYCLLAFGGIALIVSIFPASIYDFYEKYSYEIKIALTFIGCAVVIIYGLKILRTKITYTKLEAVESAKLDSAFDKANRIGEKTKKMVQRLKVPEIDKTNFFGLFFTGVMLCMSSLTLPASWIAVVGYLKGFNILNSSIPGGLLFSVGAFIGTLSWFYTLSKLITRNKDKINQKAVNKLNIIAGIILLVLGVFLFERAAVSVINIL